MFKYKLLEFVFVFVSLSSFLHHLISICVYTHCIQNTHAHINTLSYYNPTQQPLSDLIPKPLCIIHPSLFTKPPSKWEAFQDKSV